MRAFPTVLLTTALLATLALLPSCALGATPLTTIGWETPVPPAPTTTPFDESAFWESFPLPEDAELAPVAEGIDLGFTTQIVEPELFDFYAAWLRERGWAQQAPAEAVITMPRQRWRRDEMELLIELPPPDE